VEKNYNPDSDDEDDDDGTDTKGADGSDEKSDQPPIDSKLSKPVQNLISLIFNRDYQQEALHAMNYDDEKMPLGKLSKGTISRGFQALKDLAALIDASTNHAEIEQVSNMYYSIIPHDFGRNRPPVINNNALLKREIELLDSLGDMKEATEMLKASRRDDGKLNELDRQFQKLGMDEMEPLSPKSSEFAELSDYLTKTKGSTPYKTSSASNARANSNASTRVGLQRSRAIAAFSGTALESPISLVSWAKVSALRLLKPQSPVTCLVKVSTLPTCPASLQTTATATNQAERPFSYSVRRSLGTPPTS
jgi:hypothetical protein